VGRAGRKGAAGSGGNAAGTFGSMLYRPFAVYLDAVRGKVLAAAAAAPASTRAA